MGMINRKKKRTRFSSSYPTPDQDQTKKQPDLKIINEQKDKVEIDILIKKINSLIQSEEDAKKATLIISEWINQKK